MRVWCVCACVSGAESVRVRFSSGYCQVPLRVYVCVCVCVCVCQHVCVRVGQCILDDPVQVQSLDLQVLVEPSVLPYYVGLERQGWLGCFDCPGTSFTGTQSPSTWRGLEKQWSDPYEGKVASALSHSTALQQKEITLPRTVQPTVHMSWVEWSASKIAPWSSSDLHLGLSKVNSPRQAQKLNTNLNILGRLPTILLL